MTSEEILAERYRLQKEYYQRESDYEHELEDIHHNLVTLEEDFHDDLRELQAACTNHKSDNGMLYDACVYCAKEL